MGSLEILSAVSIGLGIAGMVGIPILAWIITQILVYLAAKLFNRNVSFEEALGVTILSEIVSFIIIIISFLSSMLENNNAAFFIGVDVAFIAVSIIYRYIPNVNWRKAILM